MRYPICFSAQVKKNEHVRSRRTGTARGAESLVEGARGRDRSRSDARARGYRSMERLDMASTLAIRAGRRAVRHPAKGVARQRSQADPGDSGTASVEFSAP